MGELPTHPREQDAPLSIDEDDLLQELEGRRVLVRWDQGWTLVDCRPPTSLEKNHRDAFNAQAYWYDTDTGKTISKQWRPVHFYLNKFTSQGPIAPSSSWCFVVSNASHRQVEEDLRTELANALHNNLKLKEKNQQLKAQLKNRPPKR